MSDLLTREVLLLRDCIEIAKKQWRFEIQAAVVLPSQMQILGVFESSRYGIGKAMESIQSTFEQHLPERYLPLWDGQAAISELEWSSVPLRIRFIEAAPVGAGLVERPSDWRFSTAYRESENDLRYLGADVA